jgi:ABC-2 type transport system ATP-binding protein
MRYLVIRTENLTKAFHRRVIVNNLTIEVEPGEIYGFIGPRGAGKSTTLRMLLDFVRPTAGRALVMGLDSRKNSLSVRQQVGYLPEFFSPRQQASGRQFLRSLEVLRGPLDWAYVDRLAKLLQLDLDTTLKGLDACSRRSLGLVQAFMERPELLILDEPTAGLDPARRQAFFQLAHTARTTGSAILFATQSLRDIERICDRAAFIDEGRLIAVERGVQLRGRALRRVEMRFAVPVNAEMFAGLPNLRDLCLQDNVVSCTVQGDQDGLIKLASRYRITDYVSQAPSLEEAFGAYYGVKAHAA